MLASIIEMIPLITLVYVALSIIASFVIPITYVRISKVRGERSTIPLDKKDYVVLSFLFTFLIMVLCMGCTPFIMEKADIWTNGYWAYPIFGTIFVAIVIILYFLIVFFIIKTTSEREEKRLRLESKKEGGVSAI